MEFCRIKLTSIIIIFLFSMFIFNSEIVNADGEKDIDWWPMFNKNPARLGQSISDGPDTNQVLWNKKIGFSINAFSSPIIVDNKIYFGSWDKKLYCLNYSNGDVIWYKITDGLIESTPAVWNGKVYFGSYDEKIYCLNSSTGKELWSFSTSNRVLSSPAVVDGKVYIGSDDKKIYCLDAYNGNRIWSFKTDFWVRSSPAVANGKVYVGSWDNNVYCLNAETGEKIWNYKTEDLIDFSSPAVFNGKVFVGSWDNNVYCLNAETGEKIWNYKTNDKVISSPAISNGKVYVGSWDGNFYCLNSENGTEIWKYMTQGKVASSPAVANGKVYVGSWDGNFYCLNSENGTEIWKYDTGFIVRTSPAIVNEKAYINSFLGVLYCIGSGYSPPVIDLTYDPENPYEGDVVTFSAPNKINFNKNIISWEWDFGDGVIEEGRVANHVFDNTGNYSINLTLIDYGGNNYYNSTSIYVRKDTISPSIITNLSVDYSSTNNYQGFVLFWDQALDNVRVDYYKIYRNGFFLENVTTLYFIDTEFKPCQKYSYCVAAVDVNGNEGNTSENRVIEITCPNITADAGGPYNSFIGKNILFDGSQSTAANTTISSYDWSFGDGSNDSGEKVSHSFLQSGNYPIRLTVSAENESDTDVTYAVVSVPKPNVSGLLSGNDLIGEQGKEYVFNISSSAECNCSIQYTIDWGDGEQDTTDFLDGYDSASVRHQWADAGGYNVSVWCSDNYSDSDTVSFAVLIDAQRVNGVLEGLVLDQNGDDVFDVFRDDTSGKNYSLDYSGSDTYRFKIENADYEYNVASGEVSKTSTQIPTQPVWRYVLIGIAGIISIVLVVWAKRFKKRQSNSMRFRDLPVVTAAENSSLRCVVCKGRIKVGFSGVKCKCGAILHRSCAERLGHCPICGMKYISPEELKDE